MTLFEQPAASHPDPYWREVCDFVARLGTDRSRIVAPAEFGAHLAGAVPYARASGRPWSEIDGVVIHKGWVEQLSHAFLTGMIARLTPRFANAVFVVYGAGGTIAETGPHVDAFLAMLPEAVRSATWRPVAEKRPLTVFLGNGRMLCRDPDNRKIVVPAKASALLAALADGDDVVAAVRSRIGDIAAGARTVVDIGAGCGLFLLAAKGLVAEGALFLAVERDAALADCVRFNVDLAGLFWRTEFAAEIDGPRNQQFVGRHKNASWNPADGCDLVHIDLAYPAAPRGEALTAFLQARKLPQIVVSHGLSTRIATLAADDLAVMEATLKRLGYTRGGEDRPFGRRGARIGEEIAAFRRPGRAG